jgi:hypothetical protein
MSLYVTVFAGTAPIGGLFAGAVAQAFGAAFALSLGAALASVVLIVVAWRLRSVRMPQLEQADADPTRDSPRGPTRPEAPAAAA